MLLGSAGSGQGLQWAVPFICPATEPSMAAGDGPRPGAGEEQERLKQLASARKLLWGKTWATCRGFCGRCADLWLYQ